MKTGIFYGTTTGTTQSVAERIAETLGVPSTDLHNVSETDAGTVQKYECLLLGSSTWGYGELQDDWYGFLDALKKQPLNGKKVGLFGCGNSVTYSDTFCNAVGEIYDVLSGSGVLFIGAYAPEDYDVTDSGICRDGKFIGLAVDEDNEANKTKSRLERWIAAIREEIG